jgi:hypothetical protein
VPEWGVIMSWRAMAVSGLAVAGFLLGPAAAAQAAAPAQLTGTQLASRLLSATLTTQLLKKTHVGRHPAFRAVQKATLTGLPATLNDTRVTLAGTDVYAIDALGSTVPAKPTVPAALLRLIVRVQA